MITQNITVNEAFEQLILAQKHTVPPIEKGAQEIGIQQSPRADKVSQEVGETAPCFSFTGITAANMAGRVRYGAVGKYAASFNGRSAALNKHSFAINNSTIAKGEETFAQGYETIAEGNSSFAGGTRTWARGEAAVSLGARTQALGEVSLATGADTIAEGIAAASFGNGTLAWGQYSVASGNMTKAFGHSSYAGGQGSIAGFENTEYDPNGIPGQQAEQNIAQHAEGLTTKAMAKAAHAEGWSSEATGEASHAENSSFAIGPYTHSEGWKTKAVGQSSHTEGTYTSTGNILNNGEICTPNGTSAYGLNYLAIYLDYFSVPSEEIGKTYYAYVIDQQGVLYPNLKAYFTITENFVSIQYFEIYFDSIEQANEAHSILEQVYITKEPLDISYNFNINGGLSAHAEGHETKALFECAHAEGNSTLALNFATHAEGTLTISRAAHGHAEGLRTVTLGNGAHAEGDGGEAAWTEPIHQVLESGDAVAIAQVWDMSKSFSAAIGQGSHVEGLSTMASGAGAHAEGYQTSAGGDYSHASGWGTKATGKAQTVVGKYNKIDDNAVFIVGTGNSTSPKNGLIVREDLTSLPPSYFKGGIGFYDIKEDVDLDRLMDNQGVYFINIAANGVYIGENLELPRYAKGWIFVAQDMVIQLTTIACGTFVAYYSASSNAWTQKWLIGQ